jgi:hypothetical protein
MPTSRTVRRVPGGVNARDTAVIPLRRLPDTGGGHTCHERRDPAVPRITEVIMKKGLSILVAGVLAAGLCSCGSGERSAPEGDPAGAQHVSQGHTSVPPSIGHSKFLRAV